MNKPQEFKSVIEMGLTEDARHSLAHEVVTRAVDQVYPAPKALETALVGDRQLTAYMGIDPTAPDMHVGHESQLLKLNNLQQLGHRVILLIGDFTAMIGDPSDKSAARVKLAHDEVLDNARGYKDQAGKILDFNHADNPIELAYNSEWLGKMDFGDVLELASEFTVQQMLERQSFRKRIDAQKPVGLHEFLYPMMQGWDSVKMGVDIEVGGSDQIFNMLVGSALIKRHLDKQKYVIAGQLLVDPSGKKIGKTEGNMITMNDTPLDMFHKIMLWGDAITPHALELCSQLSMDEVREIEARLQSGEMSGIDGKLFLANTIVTDLHGVDAARNAHSEYSMLTAKGSEIDRDALTVFGALDGQNIIEIMRKSGLARSNSDARRLIEGNGVRVDGMGVTTDWKFSHGEMPQVLQVGKKKLENFRLLTPLQDNKPL